MGILKFTQNSWTINDTVHIIFEGITGLDAIAVWITVVNESVPFYHWINPIHANQVLSRLPEETDVKEGRENEVEKSVVDVLKEMRYGLINTKGPKRKRKLEVIPGRSVGSSEDYEDTEEEPETVKGKSKGIGKMTKILNDKEVIHDEKEVKAREEKKVDVCQEKIDDANCLNKTKNIETYCLSNEDIEAMSITIGDYVLYDGNEIVTTENFTILGDQENLTPIKNEESKNNKVNILADEIIEE
ncbi:unnamed protein product [Euphydryas editha]|uniref:Uncharacterized protein n=1 Tax=Euphydryas editha TaxID=104508 RepID=A0AAU9UIU7_EUPED|nr:unnamed protein product [Euphydryas editha]